MQRVLVVDDDRVVADTLALIFERSGFSVRVAYGAEEAMCLAHEFTPDLLLCDIAMPGRDGISLMRDVTRELPSCRIIVLTGFYSNLNHVREQAGKLPQPVGIFTKPCEPAELIREANSMLASHRRSHV
ncbi:response regulator [Edaphobacter bradus]|uniref:response regulator n=1 Tax=Edaphobacter bradus TaxID=2259016 RepID=UPI0021DF7FBF|nr:response regulator [Edaphobacter bradus]